MAEKRKEGIQIIYACESCGKEIYRSSPKAKGLATIDLNHDEFDEIRDNFKFNEGYYLHGCGAKHRIIFSPKKEGEPLCFELGHMI